MFNDFRKRERERERNIDVREKQSVIFRTPPTMLQTTEPLGLGYSYVLTFCFEFTLDSQEVAEVVQ